MILPNWLSPFWLNAACFQLLWLGCVVGAGRYEAHSLAFLGAIPVVAFSLLSEWRWHDLLLGFGCLLLGIALDTMWIRTGILDYGTLQLAPYWIILLWVGVGLTLNHSLEPLARRPLVGALIAGAFAPISYLGGERVGAVDIPDAFALGWVALAWFLTFYGVFSLSRWMRVLRPAIRLGNLP